ncbi:hypothetical protein AB1Y20_015739 [Prymnesium parvum]|uniref:C3H1-type domain-containing protein n=1 Tax=Prymnesium parvum TaxID=97485 RepID=A0AB34JYR6_PRYPA
MTFVGVWQHRLSLTVASASAARLRLNQAQKAANVAAKRGSQAKREPSDDEPGGNGPDKTYSRRQVSAMLKQVGVSQPNKWKKPKDKGGGEGGNATAGGTPSGKALFRDFQAGRCQRGEQCRFQHVTAAEK